MGVSSVAGIGHRVSPKSVFEVCHYIAAHLLIYCYILYVHVSREFSLEQIK